MAALPFSVDQQIQILLGQVQWECPPVSKGVVPDYLEQQYARASCAASLGELESPTVPVLAALLRAAFTDPVPEVRDQSLRSIRSQCERGHVAPSSASALYWAAAEDESSNVRCTALEALWSVDETWGGELAQRLLTDPNWLVAETARGIVAVR
jgi:hypothetical protein